MVLNNAARGLHTKFFLSHKHDFSVTRSMTLMQKENASLFVYTNLSFAIFLTLFFFSCRGGTFVFTFQVSPIYPHEAPKVKCKTKVTKQTLFAHSLFAYLLYFLPTLLHGCSVYLLIFFLANTIACILTCALHLQVYHPNIDLEGNVCLNILREDWKPVLNINTIIYGLFHLFTVLIFFLRVVIATNFFLLYNCT